MNIKADQLKRFHVIVLNYFPATGCNDFITANLI